MCGIFGLHKINDNKQFTKGVGHLFLSSESRGKEASGAVFRNSQKLNFIKTPMPASKLIKSKSFKETLANLINSKGFHTVIGHSRMVTNGYENDDNNNQPVVGEGLVTTHNGIIVNYNELWELLKGFNPKSCLDSEVINSFIKNGVDKGLSVEQGIGELLSKAKGMLSCATLPLNQEKLILFTNNGSLYYSKSQDGDNFIYASERHILNQVIDQLNSNSFIKGSIKALLPGQILSLNLSNNDYSIFDNSCLDKTKLFKGEDINADVVQYSGHLTNTVNTSMEYTNSKVPKDFIKKITIRLHEIKKIKRCTKCILPETFPYIEFDHEGICSSCNSYQKTTIKGADEFSKVMKVHRLNDKTKHDCLMPFSGGRDSSYALHYVVKELGMNPIAFSYDWGMLTDLGRRNQARMCGELGVEHVLVSADIRKKRKYIRQNVSAWLKRPHLGTIPLFMAGDKQYFYYSHLIGTQNSLNISIMGENNLERTGFKSAFAGVKPPENGSMSYHVGLKDKLKMVGFYASQYLLNPSYINSSLLDSAKAFGAYYGMKHNHLNIFDYLRWDENVINDTLLRSYNWETDPETGSTWRIGDGTAAFYNYIYLMVAGFTENDTFRANQIREGQITREKGLELAEKENTPRWNSIQWYCNTIGVDWEMAVKKINSIKTLY